MLHLQKLRTLCMVAIFIYCTAAIDPLSKKDVQLSPSKLLTILNQNTNLYGTYSGKLTFNPLLESLPKTPTTNLPSSISDAALLKKYSKIYRRNGKVVMYLREHATVHDLLHFLLSANNAIIAQISGTSLTNYLSQQLRRPISDFNAQVILESNGHYEVILVDFILQTFVHYSRSSGKFVVDANNELEIAEAINNVRTQPATASSSTESSNLALAAIASTDESVEKYFFISSSQSLTVLIDSAVAQVEPDRSTFAMLHRFMQIFDSSCIALNNTDDAKKLGNFQMVALRDVWEYLSLTYIMAEQDRAYWDHSTNNDTKKYTFCRKGLERDRAAQPIFNISESEGMQRVYIHVGQIVKTSSSGRYCSLLRYLQWVADHVSDANSTLAMRANIERSAIAWLFEQACKAETVAKYVEEMDHLNTTNEKKVLTLVEVGMDEMSSAIVECLDFAIDESKSGKENGTASKRIKFVEQDLVLMRFNRNVKQLPNGSFLFMQIPMVFARDEDENIFGRFVKFVGIATNAQMRKSEYKRSNATGNDDKDEKVKEIFFKNMSSYQYASMYDSILSSDMNAKRMRSKAPLNKDLIIAIVGLSCSFSVLIGFIVYLSVVSRRKSKKVTEDESTAKDTVNVSLSRLNLH